MRKMTRVVMMKDVGARHEAAGHRPVFAPVGVFKPVKKAGEKIGCQDRGNYFQNEHFFLFPIRAERFVFLQKRSRPNPI